VEKPALSEAETGPRIFASVFAVAVAVAFLACHPRRGPAFVFAVTAVFVRHSDPAPEPAEGKEKKNP
jgi:hypothetical protein